MAKGLLKIAIGKGPAHDELEDDAMDTEEDEAVEDDDMHREAFLRMAKAIRDGDDDEAFEAYQECREYV
jgi:hypothetical protein